MFDLEARKDFYALVGLFDVARIQTSEMSSRLARSRAKRTVKASKDEDACGMPKVKP